MSKKYSDISITWNGEITSTSGWSYYSRPIIKELVKGGASVRLEMLPPTRPEQKLPKWWEEHFPILAKAQPGALRINHGGVGNQNKSTTGGPTVLLGHWETTHIPRQWISGINENFDALWVPSEHLLTDETTALLKVPTGVVPLGIDKELFANSSEKLEIANVHRTKTVFLCVGQWNQRRNMTDIVVAYLSAFSSDDPVQLVLKTFGERNTLEERQKILQLVREIKGTINKPNLPEISVIQDHLGYESFFALMRRADIYCSTSRGESKSLSLMHAAAMGKQCIYTDVLANKSLTALESELLYPCRYVLEPCASTGHTYSAMDSWARPDVCHIASSMMQAYIDNVGKDLSKARSGLKYSCEKAFSPSKSAEKIAELYRNMVKDNAVVVL